MQQYKAEEEQEYFPNDTCSSIPLDVDLLKERLAAQENNQNGCCRNNTRQPPNNSQNCKQQLTATEQPQQNFSQLLWVYLFSIQLNKATPLWTVNV